MRIVAYLYSDPLLDFLPQPEWGVDVELYQDLGDRHEWQQLIKDCQESPPDCLLLRRLEELGDTPSQVGDRLAQLEAFGIEIIATEQSYRSSSLDTANPTEARAYLVQILQEIEHSQRRRRLRQGHARNRLKALPPPGKAPYGYRRGKERYILDRSTAPVVKDFFERFLLFGSLRGAVRYLEKRYGKKISVSTGRGWLTSPVYRGDLAYHNQETIPDTHAAIISREEAAQIDRLLRRNRRLPSRTASAPRSLAGLVFCQECQNSMKISRVTARGKKEYLYLRPTNCPLSPKCSAIPYQDVLKKTIERICEDLPQAVAQINNANIDTVKRAVSAQIRQKQDILTQLPSLTEQGILDDQTAALRRYRLRTEISGLQAQLAQLPPENLGAIAQTVSLPQFWLDLSETERRFYFREFIRQINIVGQQNWELQLVFIF